jgi:hypothetical protein
LRAGRLHAKWMARASELPRRPWRRVTMRFTCSVYRAMNSLCPQDREPHTRHVVPSLMITKAAAAGVLLFGLGPLGYLHAEHAPHDPNLPTVKPEALQRLSDTRVRQQIMQESQAKYRERCVCPYQTRDAKGRSCKGRHELVQSRPRPICYPEKVTPAMISDWRRQHAK